MNHVQESSRIDSIVFNGKRKLHPPSKKSALVHLNCIGVPLVAVPSGSPVDSISLDRDRPYTVGRDPNVCDYVFSDRFISKWHCQLLFDSLFRKIYVLDGFVSCSDTAVEEFRNRLASFGNIEGKERRRVSLNGVFVNGVRIGKGLTRELLVGDEVSLVCGDYVRCALGSKVGFVVKGIFIKEEMSDELDEYVVEKCGNLVTKSSACFFKGLGSRENKRRIRLISEVPEEGFNHEVVPLSDQLSSKKCRVAIKKLHFLLKKCRNILDKDDPVTFVRQNAVSKFGSKFSFGDPDVNQYDFSRHPARVEIVKNGGIQELCQQTHTLEEQFTSLDYKFGRCCRPPGKRFYLNRLKFMENQSFDHNKVVSLPELLHPVRSIMRIFVATFTSDIKWFLSECKIPGHLPVTVACHQTERCWSSNPEKRAFSPYSDFPQLVVVCPPFPEAIAFDGDRKRQGVACHHPKFIILQRKYSIRVIITSANLVENQWYNVTNTVWWQDFPRRRVPDVSSLFTVQSYGEDKELISDFAAQLAGFMASLVIDVPSQAYWIMELTNYDFGGAEGYLVSSVPGIFSRRIPYAISNTEDAPSSKIFGTVEAFVAGLGHHFHSKNDPKGIQLKRLRSIVENSQTNSNGMTEVVLRRDKYITADVNAVSIHFANGNRISKDSIQLGFLPKCVAKWVSPLWDSGFFSFTGYVFPSETLTAALEETKVRVQLMLNVSEGPCYGRMTTLMQEEHVTAFSTLVASLQRCTGLARLDELLGRFKWPELDETEFIYGASSIGSSVNAQFMAAFSASIGKKSLQRYDSEESDPDWWCWSSSQELKNSSMKIIFPTIKTVKNASNGIYPSRRILCFSEKTWERLKAVDMWYDAIPHPCQRIGYPMHVKVARRSFCSKSSKSTYGWVYCGSHNFSPAAWGRPVFHKQAHGSSHLASLLGSKQHICNYELGIVFIFPPPTSGRSKTDSDTTNMDDVELPFCVPAPRYECSDRPATRTAMTEALAEHIQEDRSLPSEIADLEERLIEIPDELEEADDATNYTAVEMEDDKAYADMLWDQVDSSQTC